MRKPGKGWHTVEELCEEAGRRGYPATPRLVFDWIEKGLLDRTTIVSRGRHGRKGYLPEQQLELFLTLLLHRYKAPRSKKIAGLLNIPVWVWLWWGDEFIPLRQVRRALKTWAAVMARGDTTRNALQAARALAGDLGRPPSPRGGRPLLSVRRLADMIHQGRFDKEGLAEAVRTLASGDGKGRKVVIEPTQPKMSPEQVVMLIGRRIDAITHLDEIPDDMLLAARDQYKHTYPRYLLSSPATAEESLNQACVDLVTGLGLIRSNAAALPEPASQVRKKRMLGKTIRAAGRRKERK